jgi:hypothetical protein
MAFRLIHQMGSAFRDFKRRKKAGRKIPFPPRPFEEISAADQLQPVVEPQVSHFMQVPLRTSVKLPQPGQASPS